MPESRSHFHGGFDDETVRPAAYPDFFQGTAFQRLGGGGKAFAALTFMLPGMPLLYSGQEAGVSRPVQFHEPDSVPWRPHEMAAFYKTPIRFRKEHPALWSGEAGGEFVRIPKTAAFYPFCG